jgi:hypothetical protein
MAFTSELMAYVVPLCYADVPLGSHAIQQCQQPILDILGGDDTSYCAGGPRVAYLDQVYVR